MPFDTRVLVTTLVQMQPRLAEILILLVEESRQVTAAFPEPIFFEVIILLISTNKPSIHYAHELH